MSGSILTRSQIEYEMREATPIEERLFISPLLDKSQIGDTSIDVRLGQYFLVSQPSPLGVLDLIDLHRGGTAALADGYRLVRVPLGQYFTLHPGESVQVGTLEYLGIPPHLQGLISLRASLSDLPVSSRTTQVHPGHKGTVTLTLVSHSKFSIKLPPGLRVAELQLQYVSGTLSVPRPSRHHAKTRPGPPRLHEDEDLRFLGPAVEPIIVGVASTIAAGRTTVVRRLEDFHGFTTFSLATALKAYAARTGRLTQRSELQRLGQELREMHGDAELAIRLRHDAAWLSSRMPLVVVDGFKHPAEVVEFRKQKRFVLLGITADEEVRWARVLERERPGEPKTREGFEELDATDRGSDKILHSQATDRVLDMANHLIENNGSLGDLHREVDEFVQTVVFPSIIQRH